MTNSEILRSNPRMITRTIDGEAVIMDPQKGKVLALNRVGTFIWEKSDGQHTREDILEAICREFEVDKAVAAADLDEFITILQSKNLL